MTRKPNILLIHADQHRFDCLGCCGNRDIRTPHIDALADDGVRYTHSFCPHPVCTPSRYSLLSSQYIHQHRGLTNESTLDPAIPTLPRLLRQNGYRTTAVGKMHFTPTYLDVGFDAMWLAEQHGKGRYEDDYHRWLRSEGVIDRLDMLDQVEAFRRDAPPDYWETFGALPSDLDEAHHSTTWIGDRAVDCIDEWGEGGHFLMAGFIKPHHPFDPPQPWADMYDPDALSLLPGWTESPIHGDTGKGFFPFDQLSEAALRQVMAMYYATISQIDHHVGRMIDSLKAKGLYDDTLIVYTSDHGDFMGYHHRILKSHHMLDPVMRVPLIIKFPGQNPGTDIDSRLVNNIDVAPTLLSAVGLEPAESMQGLDLTDPAATADCVLAEMPDEYMVRSRTHKLLLHRDPAQSLFFDLEHDPLELVNLYGKSEYKETVAALRGRISGWPLFKDGPGKHLDPAAAQCQADNIPDGDTGLYTHFRTIMEMNAGRPVGAPLEMPAIRYATGNDLDVDAVIELYEASTLGERRPTESPEIFREMIRNADLVITAWDGDTLVGIARTLTDFAYVAYLADLAVHQDYQRRGIGKELIRRTRGALKDSCFITLLAAPRADAYYGKLGFERNPRAWMLKPDEIPE